MNQEYPIDWETLEIPEWLKVPDEERRAAWAGRTVTTTYRDYRDGNLRAPTREEVRRLRDKKRAERTPEQRAKQAQSLAAMKAKHEGERYDRKLKKWVPKEKDHD